MAAFPSFPRLALLLRVGLPVSFWVLSPILYGRFDGRTYIKSCLINASKRLEPSPHCKLSDQSELRVAF